MGRAVRRRLQRGANCANRIFMFSMKTRTTTKKTPFRVSLVCAR